RNLCLLRRHPKPPHSQNSSSSWSSSSRVKRRFYVRDSSVLNLINIQFLVVKWALHPTAITQIINAMPNGFSCAVCSSSNSNSNSNSYLSLSCAVCSTSNSGLSATKGISDQKLCEPNQRAGGDDGRCAGDKNADSNKEPSRSLFAD